MRNLVLISSLALLVTGCQQTSDQNPPNNGAPVDSIETHKSFDKHGRYILNNEPFFPIGMYWGKPSKEWLEVFADSKFNCVIPYSRNLDSLDLDLFHEYGLKVAYPLNGFFMNDPYDYSGEIQTVEDEKRIIQERVALYKDHPAVFAWYTNDEKPVETIKNLTQHYNWVTEVDSLKPCLTVLWQYHQVKYYLDSFDVVGSTVYPIGMADREVSEAKYKTRQVKAQTTKPVWQVPQMHNWKVYPHHDAPEARTPTYEEMRALTWLCIAEGAQGIVGYNFTDVIKDPDTPFEQQWPRIRAIAEEIDRYAPFLLSVEETPNATLHTDSPWLSWFVKKKDDKVMMFMVNDGSGGGVVHFTFEEEKYTMPPMHLDSLQVKMYLVDAEV